MRLEKSTPVQEGTQWAKKSSHNADELFSITYSL